MLLTIEIPDNHAQLFADTFGLVNDVNLKTSGETMLSEYVHHQMKIRYVHTAEESAKELVRTVLPDGVIKPGQETAK
jgi:hypothetical protein